MKALAGPLDGRCHTSIDRESGDGRRQGDIFLHFGAQKPLKGGRPRAVEFEAFAAEKRAYLAALQRLCHRLCEGLDDRRRRVARRQQSVPRGVFISRRTAFGDRRQVGEGGRTFGRTHCQWTQTAGLGVRQYRQRAGEKDGRFPPPPAAQPSPCRQCA